MVKETDQYKTAEKKHNQMVGKTMIFSGGLFSRKRSEPQKEYKILDWRWGSAKIMNMETMEMEHPTVEYLIKNSEMKRSRWTKPFPVREINLKGIE